VEVEKDCLVVRVDQMDFSVPVVRKTTILAQVVDEISLEHIF
jgi:hypothetical protein